MICNVCFRMLRGQVGRQLRGSWDLSFDHQPDLGSLHDSARARCYICRRIWEAMPLGHDRSRVSICLPAKQRPSLSHISWPWKAAHTIDLISYCMEKSTPHFPSARCCSSQPVCDTFTLESNDLHVTQTAALKVTCTLLNRRRLTRTRFYI